MIKISIIVPVYNVELYLRRCLDTIINQTLNEIEIILVNDGSSDNSLDICRYYERLDSRIIILDKKNEGVSSARNEGLKVARGEYIGFVDPDDWIDFNMYESMYTKAKTGNYDIVMCNYFLERKISEKVEINLSKKKFIGNDEILEWIIKNMIAPVDLNSNQICIAGAVWRMIFRRNIILSNSICFKRNLMYGEDLIFSIESLVNCNRVYILDEYYYHYFKREGSATNIYRYNHFEEMLELEENIVEILKERQLYSEFENRVNIRHYLNYISQIQNLLKKGCPYSYKEKLKFINEFCSDTVVRNIVEKQKSYNYCVRKEIYNFLIKKKLVHFILIYHQLVNLILSLKE